MKTKKWMLIGAMGLSIGFFSCTENNTPTDEGPVYRDDLQMVTEALFRTDSLGNIIAGPNIGDAINPETPTEYYAGAKSVKDAKEKFLMYIHNDIKLEEEGNNVTVILRDSANNIQGKIFFTEASDNAGGKLAEVTFSEEIHFPNFTKLTFRVADDVSTSRYKLWSVVIVQDSEYGNPTGLCIKENANGERGLIIVPTTKEAERKAGVSNCSPGTLHYVYETYNALGKSTVNAKLNEIGLNDLNHKFWTNKVDNHKLWSCRHWVDLSDDNEGTYKTGGSSKCYNFIGYLFDGDQVW